MISNISFENINNKKVVDYYKNLESRLGYTFLTWDTKHFGYYPSKRGNISERKAQVLMIELLAKKLQLKKKDLVLDAGCGRGTTTCYLAQKYGCKLIGIDIVPFEIDISIKKAQEQRLENKTNFYLRDYSDTKFPDNYFNKIFTLETLVHSFNLHKTLGEFYRILKPGGRLVLFEYSRAYSHEFSEWENKMIGIINEGSAMTSFNNMYHDTFSNYIKEAGFAVLSDSDITAYMEPSLERFYRYAKIPYSIIKLLHLQHFFINTTAGVEFYKLIKKRLVKYRVFIAEKI